MNPEELLKTLRDGGLDDDAIKKLLGDTLGMLDEAYAKHDEVDEADERKQAGELLGVAL
jgi:hypothetical protein